VPRRQRLRRQRLNAFSLKNLLRLLASLKRFETVKKTLGALIQPGFLERFIPLMTTKSAAKKE